MEVGRREIIHLLLHCHHQNDSCTKMGSDESRFNVSYLWGTKSQDSVHRPQFLKRKESRSGFEPGSLCLPQPPNALSLGQTGSLSRSAWPGRAIHSCMNDCWNSCVTVGTAAWVNTGKPREWQLKQPREWLLEQLCQWVTAETSAWVTVETAAWVTAETAV